jgi:hypothetical protein
MKVSLEFPDTASLTQFDHDYLKQVFVKTISKHLDVSRKCWGDNLSNITSNSKSYNVWEILSTRSPSPLLSNSVDKVIDGSSLSNIKSTHTLDMSMKNAYPARRVGMMIAGLEVPHTHIHLVPMDSMADLSFAKARDAKPEDLAEAAARIRKELGGS